MRILVTGAAGFIGSHTSEALLRAGHDVVALDNLNAFYDPALKLRNLAEISATSQQTGQTFELHVGDIRDFAFVRPLAQGTDAIVHLAAAAGVRPSIEAPMMYEEVNVRGTLHVLEAARLADVKRVIFASSSSIYGDNPIVPFAEHHAVDHPISPYAATKRAGELLCQTWHHLYGIHIACLRFFTVYGPRQRPDLAINKFTRQLLHDNAIELFGDGKTSRDYTYIDDTVAGIVQALHWTAANAKCETFNLGNSSPLTLADLVAHLEAATGKIAAIHRLPLQPGDVSCTFADIAKAREAFGYAPLTNFSEGAAKFVAWARRQAEFTVSAEIVAKTP